MIRKDIIELFRVPTDGKVRLKDYNPAGSRSAEFEDFGKDALKERAQQVLDTEPGGPGGGTGPALCG